MHMTDHLLESRPIDQFMTQEGAEEKFFFCSHAVSSAAAPTAQPSPKQHEEPQSAGQPAPDGDRTDVTDYSVTAAQTSQKMHRLPNRIAAALSATLAKTYANPKTQSSSDRNLAHAIP
jgi:hypothetical protein